MKGSENNKKSVMLCAIIGLGRIASLLEDDSRREKPASHAGAVAAHAEARLTAGMDSDPERRELFSKRWNVEAVYDDAALMLAEMQPDILHICTHADSHLDYLKLAVRSKVPVVVLEKPVSLSLRKAQQMRKVLAAGKTRVVVNHERRYSRDYLSALKLIQSEEFGLVRSVTARLYMGRERPVEAVLLYDGTHLFDIISFLLGAPVGRIRKAGGGRNSRTLIASAECAGVPVLAEVGSGRDHVVFEIDISFETGRLRIGNGLYEVWESGESPFYDNMRSLKLRDTPRESLTGYFSGMFEDAVCLVKDPHAVPVSSYDDGVESLRIVEMIKRSFRL